MVMLSDSFTIFGLWVLGLSVSHINESQLQTFESRSLFFMISLQYHCILGLTEIKTLHPKKKLCAKDAGWAGKKSLHVVAPKLFAMEFYKGIKGK